MVDSSVVVNLSNKLQNLKSYQKSDNSKIDDKVDFKSYLSNEVSNNIPDKKLNDKSNVNENIDEKSMDLEGNEISNKELVSKISEKLEKILDNENLDVDSLDENLNEVIILLLNLIEVNLKELNINTPEEMNYKSQSIEELSNLSFINNSDYEILKDGSDLTLNSSEADSTKEVLKNINNLVDELLDNVNSYKVSEDVSIDTIEAGLLKEFKNLLNSLPEETVKEVEKNLNTDISKEIFNALILKSKNDFSNKEEANVDKSTVVQVNTNINKKDFNSTLTDDLKEDNFNDNSSLNNKAVNKEEKVLMKILDDDNNQSFSKVLNYYDKLNKTNSVIEVIKETVVINKDNINIDFIKNIKYMVKNSLEELNVKIYPKELGEMTIKLISQEGIMKAEIKATSKETYNLLNSNLNDIKKTLENQNIRIQEVNIGIYNEDTTFFSGRENSKEEFENQRVSKVNNRSLEEEEIIEDLLNEGNVNLLA